MEMKDIYQRVTNQIISDLEKGICPWIKPWGAAHFDGRVVLPLLVACISPRLEGDRQRVRPPAPRGREK